MTKAGTIRAAPTPVRAIETDDPARVLDFAVARFRAGAVALATLVDIRGGAARALGSHVVVAADGAYAGYVSGGCVEAAVAGEALLALRDGRDRTVCYGAGAPFFDIVLPCGGGITIAIHVLREVAAIERVLDCLRRRQPAGLRYAPKRQALAFVPAPERTGGSDGDFISVYRPATRLVISGRSIEAQALARLAACAGHEVVRLDPVRPAHDLDGIVDAHTAIALLHHDLDAELPVLRKALPLPAFYIGALGSVRTHRARLDRLRAQGLADADLARIKAPIGLFGPARDANALAISVLADVGAARSATLP